MQLRNSVRVVMIVSSNGPIDSSRNACRFGSSLSCDCHLVYRSHAGVMRRRAEVEEGEEEAWRAP